MHKSFPMKGKKSNCCFCLSVFLSAMWRWVSWSMIIHSWTDFIWWMTAWNILNHLSVFFSQPLKWIKHSAKNRLLFVKGWERYASYQVCLSWWGLPFKFTAINWNDHFKLVELAFRYYFRKFGDFKMNWAIDLRFVWCPVWW